MDYSKKRTFGPTPNYPLVEKYKRPEHHKRFILQAGPCSYEGEDMYNDIAQIVKYYGATHLRGHVFKAGTYYNENFGFIDKKEIYKSYHIALKNNLSRVVEVLDYSDEALKLYLNTSDAFQIGARSCQNYSLLKKLSYHKRDVFIKRGAGVKLDELLGACEYLLQGNCYPIIIERGSISYLDHVRYDLSLSMVQAIKSITDIPVIVDPSHGTGRADLVESMALAGVASGADGLLLEVHTDPENSVSDSEQAIDFETFKRIINKSNKIREIVKGE